MWRSRDLVLVHTLLLSGFSAAVSWEGSSTVKRADPSPAASQVPANFPSAPSVYPSAPSVYPSAPSVYPSAPSVNPSASSVYAPVPFVPHVHSSDWQGHGEHSGLALIKRSHSWKARPECDPYVLERQSNYICDSHGHIICMPGWEGPGCQVPICNRRQGCGPHGTCVAPGKCSCEIGYFGTSCEICVRMPGCLHGHCTKSYECICEPGWQGPLCDIPICKEGCQQGTCKSPGECVCNAGYKGLNCDQCIRTPGCMHGMCTRPYQCNCLPGWKGTDCDQPICLQGCHPEFGRCSYPGECICRTGYQGKLCDKCFTYPGCVNGYCEKPWECICKKGWSGPLCNKQGNVGPLNGTSSTNLNNSPRYSSWESIESSEERSGFSSYEDTRPRYFGRSPEGEERNRRGNSSLLEELPMVDDGLVQEQTAVVAEELTTRPR